MVKRSAFTFIELIFAIIIIAITVISLPMVTQVTSKNANSNVVQEAIFAAATELNEVTTVHWDENASDSNDTKTLLKVINIDNSCEDNSSSQRYRLRPGHIAEALHRRCLNDLTQGEADSNSNDNIDAVEDKLHASQTIFLNTDPSASGYKDDYQSILSVTYSPLFAGAHRSNMKKITSTITDSDGKTIIKLSTYVANIGEVDYYKRSY